MNVNIYLEDELGKTLNELSEELGMKRNAIIREALHEWVQNHRIAKWPRSVLEFQGVKDFPAFEADRKKLKKPKTDPFE